MAFIILADSRSDEIDRRELAGPITIGRSPECELPVRDILLSRRHCLIERIGDAWVIADLGSKNGTRVNGDLINRHVLHDMDLVRIGRTRIAFREGVFIPAPPEVKLARQQPADPLEAMSGTLSGFKFNDDEEEALDRRVLETFPRPRPHPVEPRAYQSEHVQALITDIASSAWDSVLVEVDRSTKTTTLPRPMVTPVYREVETAPKPVAWKKKTWFSARRTLAMLYVAISMLVTGVCVWVISWGW